MFSLLWYQYCTSLQPTTGSAFTSSACSTLAPVLILLLPPLQNVLGCDVGQYAGDVAFIADDAKLECDGKDAGKCASNISIPQRNK